MPTYSIGQAARLLGVSPETVRRWADGGRLHGVPVRTLSPATNGGDLVQCRHRPGTGETSYQKADEERDSLSALSTACTTHRLSDACACLPIRNR
ncbi:MerR family DNA-binding transcriptional regulator [Streptomyces sp. NPDC006539]|uniref:MerR family DNA-binding transcriptional regulator n=1 Tax=Streptomyces sp. NPDC006539 TaxID=3155352 RepID=UPI0033973F81